MKLTKSAFTLVELIIVVVIIGILASVVAPMMQGMKKKSKLTEMYVVVSALVAAERAYYTEYQAYLGYNDGVPSHQVIAGWSNPNNPNCTFAKGLKDLLGVDVYPNAAPEFSYAVDNIRVYVCHVLNGSYNGLTYYDYRAKKWHLYSMNNDDGWKKYLQFVDYTS